MPTTSVGTDRKPYQALEKYDDAVFLTDDKKFFFGNDGDGSMEYDEDGLNRILFAGADRQLSDTQQLLFGDAGDAGISWDTARLALSGTWDLAGVDMQFSDTQQLQWGNSGDVKAWFNPNTGSGTLMLSGIMASDPVIENGLYYSDTGGAKVLCISIP